MPVAPDTNLSRLASRRVVELRNEVLPFGGLTMRHAGVPVVGNPDPVIAFLSQRGEETYRLMERSETSIWNAREHVDTRILAAGSEVVRGESGSPAAEQLLAFAIDFLRRIPRWIEVQARMLDAVYWGWRPLELLWEPATGPDGRPRWYVAAAIEKPPELFRFTPDRELILLDPQARQPRVLDSPTDRIHWMACTYGSIDNPYGEALYQKVWLLWYAKQRFFQLWATGMERSMGLLKMERTAPEDLTQDATEAWAAIRTDVTQALQRLREAGVLVSMPGWKTEFMTDVDFSSGWQGVIDYCNREMATAVAGETLSFTEAEFGTRAQAQTHRSSGLDVARRRAKALEGWVNDMLLARALDLNFGVVAPDDRPKWRCLVGREMSLEGTQALFDMGAPIDGRRTAEVLNVALVTEPEEGDLVLKKQAAPKVTPFAAAPPPPPGGQEAPEPPEPEEIEEPEEPEGERATRAARPEAAEDAEAHERATAALVASAIATSGPLFERRVSALVDEFLKANPDPFV